MNLHVHYGTKVKVLALDLRTLAQNQTVGITIICAVTSKNLYTTVCNLLYTKLLPTYKTASIPGQIDLVTSQFDLI